MTDRKFEIRGETRLKNGVLVRAREEAGMDQKVFAKMVGIPYGEYNAYENLRSYPRPKHRRILSEYCQLTEDELFPKELERYAAGEEPRKLVQNAIIEPSRLLGTVRREALLVASTSTPESEFFERERQDEVEKAINTLKSDNEKKVLRLIFGLDGNDPATLEEIAIQLGVTRSRIGQLRDNAMQKLRNGLYHRVLRDLHQLS